MIQGHSFVVVSFDDLQQIHSKNFKDHYKMFAMWSQMKEAVQKLNAIAIISRNIFKFLRILLVIFFQRLKPFGLHPVRRNLV